MKKPTKLRRWRIIHVRKRGRPLGTVEAADAASAIKPPRSCSESIRPG